ncbi:MAG TPA: hemagglutinin repeat-containing protein [Noviherbaspirillum sp.]|nr:hemagglutinin repeat-containing protein [Noviherbaspirillum sp.]
MNKLCYRIVFNKARGLLMAVAEVVMSRGKTPVTGSVGTSTVWHKAGFGLVRMLSVAIWSALGLVTWTDVVSAQIIADHNAPATQRPTILQSANGIPLVNIQTPSAAGVSRNTYSQFDVQQQGAILNNSAGNVQTQLGGWVQGNPWLATGSARVILNEVNSSNPSLLRGYVEVAGSRAQVVVANPSGVSCDGCGFINASRATLTTGTPIINGGSLDGYRVQGGVISITGAGMDASTTDYTDLIARSVQINAGVWAKQLMLTAGANQVNADNTQASPIQRTGTAPTIGIDVAQLGGMYAGKIILVGTEAGVGVRNAGQIGASAGDIVVTANGRLENTGSITAAGNAQLSAENGIQNSGNLFAQANASLATHGDINNSGLIAAQGNTTLTANGAVSHISGTSGSVFGAGIQTDGGVGTIGNLTVSATQTITSQGQNFSGGNQIMTAQSIHLEASQITAQNLSITATHGDLNLQSANVAVAQNLSANATQTVHTDQAQVAANQIDIAAHDLSNIQGQILQVGTGDISLMLPGQLDNTRGRIATNSRNVSISAETVTNTGGTLLANGNATLNVGTLVNDGGTIQTSGGASANLAVHATGGVSNQAQAGTHGQISASGNADIVASQIDNRGGSITSGQALNVNAAQTILNQQGTLAANQDVRVNAATVDNTQGSIGSVQGQLAITANSGVVNNATGHIEAAKTLTVSSQGVNNSGGILSGGSLALNSQLQAIDNTGGIIAAIGTLDIQSGALNNNTGLISAQEALTVNTHGQTLTNTNAGTVGGIVGQGTVTLATGDLNNHAGYIGSAGALNLNGNAIDNSQGTLASTSQLDLNGASLDNQSGQMQVMGNANITASIVTNNSGLMRSGQTLTVNANSIDNSNTLGNDQGMEGDNVALHADVIRNQSGAIRANTAATLVGGGSIDNTQGTISAVGTVTLQDTHPVSKSLAITNTNGILIAGQQLTADGARLSGDGKLLSQGDLLVKVDGDYAQTGLLQANGKATLQTAGILTNASTMMAGNALNLTAATINNQAGGQMQANAVSLHATDSHTLTNRGLINGSDTFIDTITLNNVGTGRIYGDHIAIAADTVNNAPENGIAPVIAARDRLDIGAQTITNGEHALMFSAGDLAIGGSLDANHQAAGQAAVLNNNSATIEALGNVTISASQINNNNLHFSTADVVTGIGPVTEYQGSGSANRYVPGAPGVYIFTDESDYLHTPEGNYEQWMQYNYTRTTIQTEVQSTDPAKILAGGNMNLAANTLNNNNSSILAGGNLTGNITHLNNAAAQGNITTTDVGTVTSYWRNYEKGTDSTGSSQSAYQPATVIQPISLTTVAYQGHASTGATGTQIANLAVGNVNQSASGAQSANTGVRNGTNVTPITQVAAPDNGMVVRTGGVNTSVPNNSLYRYQSTPGTHYLIATDPAFVDYRTWLSSDYMLNALSLDPALMQARLGDGFYEQRLVNEQVAQLTGQRYLAGYADDQSEYQALMNNGVAYAKQYHLTPGVALTDAQMAALTTDIVWLVSKTVTLPDGSTQQALVPQVYVQVKDGDLQSSGALIAGNNVNLNISGDLVNGSTIAGRNIVSLTAQNAQNLGGRITGSTVAVQAANDLNNIGGTIDAANNLTALAGHDLNVVTTTSTQSNAQGSTTNLGRVAGLYVTGNAGTLIAAAGHDINFNAATITNGDGSGTGSGSTLIAAGNNLNLGTVTQSSSHQIVWDSNNRRQDSTTVEVGSTIQTQGDLQMQAGSNINARATSITSNAGAIRMQAGQDINITAGQTTQTVDEAHQHTGTSGMLSSTTITTRDTLDQTIAQGSTVSGNTVDIQAGRNIALAGSNVVSTAGTTLAAQNDVTIATATNTTQQSHFRDEKTSGLFSGGGFGVTIGTQQLSTDQKDVQTTASASIVGSTNGNVNITAGNHYTQTGSDVLAPQGNIAIHAKTVDINEARNTDTNTVETKFQQSGLTVAVSNPVISAVQTAQQMSKAAGQTSDGRMKALAGATTALAGMDAYNAVKAGQGTTINDKPNQIQTGTDANGNPTSRDANAADKVGGINVSISIGASQSRSNTTQASNTAASSTVAAGGNVSISATGAGSDSNLTVQGSDIKAGNNVNLQADNQIKLLAAGNTSEQHSTNSSTSGSIGVSIGTNGFGVTASASAGRGHADGTDQNWTNTHVEAGNQLTMQSGGDTTLRGAVATGKQVTANVGGNLNIESLQDTSIYDSKQQSIGGSITVGAGGGGSISFSSSKVNSDYASVTEQSGIKAGDAGFNVKVTGNTDLKGGAITSTQAAVDSNSNQFTTGTLTLSDIQNYATYDASAVGVSVGTSVNQTGKYQPTGTGAGVGSDSGSANSITQAAISGIAGNKDARSSDKESGIGKIFDAEKVQNDVNAQVTITQAFGQRAANAIGTYATNKENNLRGQAEAEKLAGDEVTAKALNIEADKWADGGEYRVALHTATGALTGGLQGAAGAYVSSEAMPQIGKMIDNMDLPPAVKSGLADVAATALGAAVGGTAGAAASLNVDANNRQLHEAEKARIQALAKGDPQKEARLTAAACALVKCYAEYPEGSQAYQQLKQIADIGESDALSGERKLLSQQSGMFGYTTSGVFSDANIDATKRINNTYQITTRALGGLQAVGGAVTTVAGAGVTAAGAVTCPETGIGCLAAAGGTAMMGYGLDQSKAGVGTVASGQQQPTLGGQLLQQMLGVSPQTAELMYGLAGLTPAAVEATLANQAANKSTQMYNLSRASYENFTPNGLTVTSDVMQSPQAQALMKAIQAGNPQMSASRVEDIAINYLQSGENLPQIGIASQGSVLVKVVPKGDEVSDNSGYWMSPQQAQAIASMAPDQVAKVLGLPASQAANITKNGMDFYAITPKSGTTPTVFISDVAKTTQGAVTTTGGAQQVIVPNRNLWTTPAPVNPFTLRTSIGSK